MVNQSKCVQSSSLLQEGVSCALATLNAIASADLFRDLPAETEAHAHHNNGLWLLSMLEDHLRRLQQRVDALDEPASATATEGR